MARQSRPYHLLAPVWGDRFVRLYLEVVVLAQLAEGNLPALSDCPDNRYIIYRECRSAYEPV